MIRPAMLAVAGALLFASASATAASAQTPAAAPATGYSIQSTVGDLLDNPATKAVLNKYVPEMVSSPQIDQGRPFPLEGIASYVPTLTPEMLAKIDTELKAVPMKK